MRTRAIDTGACVSRPEGWKLSDLRSRFEEVAGRLSDRARGRNRRAAAEQPALQEDYWQSFQDLFTRDVTEKGFRELLEDEAREVFHYFTREIELGDLVGKPWYVRHPETLWRIFKALAYRLKPARRAVFAAAAVVLALAWLLGLLHLALRALASLLRLSPWPLVDLPSWPAVLLVAGTVLLFLMLLELRDKLGLKGDLEIARQIQFGLLPFEPVEQDGFEVRASMRPANTVGGDYFDLIELGPHRTAIVIGDVAGKGMPAALLMALLQGSLRTLVSAGLRGEALVRQLNRHLVANIPSNRLVTLFYGELATETGRLEYVNAGHNPPLLVSPSGATQRLEATAMALGVVAEIEIARAEVVLQPGDRLLLYTDGVTEAFDRRDEEFGEARLVALLEAQRGLGSEQLLERLTADVLEFCGPVRPRDDMTALLVTRTIP